MHTVNILRHNFFFCWIFSQPKSAKRALTSYIKYFNIKLTFWGALHIVKWKYKLLSHVQLFATPWTMPARLLYPWDFPGKNTGVGCHSLLQGIFLTQVSCIAGRFFTIWATWEALAHCGRLYFSKMVTSIYVPFHMLWCGIFLHWEVESLFSPFETVHLFIPVLINRISSVQLFSHVRLFATPWTAACQASIEV